MAIIDISGCKFGKLLVIDRSANDKYGNALWNCKCDCGNLIIVQGSSLRSGHAKSCGCYQKARMKEINTKHGRHKESIYKVWSAMIQRCNNPENASYPHYGGRGIKVCTEWHDASNFIKWALENGYKKELTIERIDNDKGYHPDNCKFVSQADQNRNTSRINFVQNDDETLTTAQVAEILGLSRSTTAKWYRVEGLRTYQEFVERRKKVTQLTKAER